MKKKLLAFTLIPIAYGIPLFIETDFNPLNWCWADKVLLLAGGVFALVNFYLSFDSKAPAQGKSINTRLYSAIKGSEFKRVLYENGNWFVYRSDNDFERFFDLTTMIEYLESNKGKDGSE